MKWLWCFLLLFLFNSNITGQPLSNPVSFIPDSLTKTTAGIAEFINDKFTSNHDKLRAAYAWVTASIIYDTDSSNQINLGEDPLAKITEALRRRKGVCENFAAVFHDIVVKTGIQAHVVSGYTKQNGFVDKTGHSWVAVKLDNDWLLCDPTWDAGGETKYFLSSPGDFILTHMPFDPLWQLLNFPVSHAEFSNSWEKKKDKAYFNFKDSLTAYFLMDSLQQFNSTASRIERAGIQNNLVKDNLNYNKMQIEMLKQDNDIDLYNSAVEDLNNAAKILNNFLQYRNNQFLPEKTDLELRNSMQGIYKIFSAANRKLDKIDKSTANFAISTDPVRQRLTSLKTRVKEQQEFIEKYLALPREQRISLFYKK